MYSAKAVLLNCLFLVVPKEKEKNVKWLLNYDTLNTATF